MKLYATRYLAKRWVAAHTSLKEGVLTMTEDQPGLVEFRFCVHRMKQVTLDLMSASLNSLNQLVLASR